MNPKMTFPQPAATISSPVDIRPFELFVRTPSEIVLQLEASFSHTNGLLKAIDAADTSMNSYRFLDHPNSRCKTFPSDKLLLVQKPSFPTFSGLLFCFFQVFFKRAPPRPSPWRWGEAQWYHCPVITPKNMTGWQYDFILPNPQIPLKKWDGIMIIEYDRILC